MQPHYGLRCFGRCIICIFGPVDLPSLIGSSSTAEPLTAMHRCLNLLSCTPTTTKRPRTLPNPELSRGKHAWSHPPISHKCDTRQVPLPSIYNQLCVCVYVCMYECIAMRALSTRVSHSRIRCCYLTPCMHVTGRKS